MFNENIEERLKRERRELAQRVTETSQDIADDHDTTKRRLKNWMAGGRGWFSERMQRHLDCETAALEKRVARQMEELRQDRLYMECRLGCSADQQQCEMDALMEAMGCPGPSQGSDDKKKKKKKKKKSE